MGYNRTSLFDLGIVNINNDQILQNEISLGRWIVDALTLLMSNGESYNLAKEIPIKQLGITYIPTLYLPKGCDALDLKGSTIIEIKNNLLFDTEIRQSDIYRLLVNDGVVDNLLIVYINSNQHHFQGENIFSVYSCHLLVSSAFVRSIHFCPLFNPSLHEIFPWYL